MSIKDTTSLVFVKGKNLYDKNSNFGNVLIDNNGVSSANNVWTASNNIKVKCNTEYTLSWTNINSSQQPQIEICEYKEDGTFIGNNFQTLNAGVTSYTKTLNSNTAFVKVLYRNDRQDNIQFEQGSTATTYQEYEDRKIMIKNKNGVYEEFYNENENKLSSNIIWKGNHYAKGNSNMQYFNKPLEDGKLYMFYAYGISVNFIQAIPFIAGVSDYIQQSYYDGSTAARWRIMINSNKTGFYLDDNSLNMQANTAIISCIKVDN